ncbi:uncharacterized protein LOC136070590 [Quercus suber]|uniref:uncharacterized protein LOC136070590 n=1 Tax=Quercus suber TaxID=58331 RepID=UPI0032E00985
MEIEPVFREKQSFRIDYFLYIVDRAISSIENRFEQFQIFGSFCRKKFFKIKINKIISKIDNVPRKIK